MLETLAYGMPERASRRDRVGMAKAKAWQLKLAGMEEGVEDGLEVFDFTVGA